MKTHLTVWGLLTFAILGLCMSGYLTYLSLMPPTSCPVGEFGAFSCNEVIYSQYARVYGISVALLGLGWFVVALGLIVFAWRDQRLMWAVVAWSILGAAGIAGFVYTELFLLESICPLCTFAHVIGLAILSLSIVNARHPRSLGANSSRVET